MCEYTKNNTCLITNSVCPWRFLCHKDGVWKDNKYMPQDCKIKQLADVPNGYCRVREERKGWLYIDYNEQTIRVKNPFDYVPRFVKVRKLKTGEYKLKD